MATGKELMTSCLVMTLLSVAPCRPVDKVAVFREQLGSVALGLCDLASAEKQYRDFMFGGRLINISSTPEVIKWPVASSSRNRSQDVQQLVCYIADYLGNHMPKIIDTFRADALYSLTAKIRAFNVTFRAAAWKALLPTDLPDCERTDVEKDDSPKMTAGLEILHFSRRWVEEFTNRTCVFGTLE